MPRFAHIACFCLLLALGAIAPPFEPRVDQPPITAKDRQRLVNEIAGLVLHRYVMEGQANAMAATLHGQLASGAYDSIADGETFAKRLTEDLRQVSDDKHIGVTFTTAAISGAPAATSPATQPENPISPQRARAAQFNHFGFDRIERLAGEVWLVELTEFVPLELSRQTIVAAMNFVAPANALIIDLRRNSGGNPGTEAFLAGFLFDQPQELSAFDSRLDGSHTTFTATPDDAAGPRFGGTKPLFILTSDFTFSAGEALAYDLQACGRAVIVGETTGGGAHATELHRIDEHFSMRIPIARPINPITKTNWQGAGVKPDVPIKADRALLAAHVAALKAIPRDALPSAFAESRVDQIIAEKERELAADR